MTGVPEIIPAQTYSQFVLSLSPTVYLNAIDEASPSVLTDSSGGGHNFTLAGSLDPLGFTLPSWWQARMGTHTPLFTGAAGLGAASQANRAEALLLGHTQYVAVFWMYVDTAANPAGSGVTYQVFREGNSGAGFNELNLTTSGFNPLTPVFNTRNDTGSSSNINGNAFYFRKQHIMLAVLRDGATVRIYLNGGLNRGGTLTFATATQGTGSPMFRLGASGTTANPFSGTIYRVGLWNNLTAFKSGSTYLDSVFKQMYDLGVPIPTNHNKPIHQLPFHPRSFHLMRMPKVLPVDPGYTSGQITALQTELGRQMNLQNPVGPAISSSTAVTKMYYIDDNTDPAEYVEQRVRVTGGQFANTRQDPNGLWIGLDGIPVPVDAWQSGGADTSLDNAMTIIDARTSMTTPPPGWTPGQIVFREFFRMEQQVGPPGLAGGQFISQVVASGGPGLSAGTYSYGFSFFTGLASVTDGSGDGSVITKNITVVAGNQVTYTLPQCQESSSEITGFHVWRKDPGGNWRILDTVLRGASGYPTYVDYANTRLQYIDNGTKTPNPATDTATLPDGIKTGNTTGWTCGLGGWHPNMRNMRGTFRTPDWVALNRDDQGGTATSIPKAVGIITHREMEQGVCDHALCVGIGASQLGANSFVYPASRNDGKVAGNVIVEGTFFAIPRSVDISSVAGSKFMHMCAQAMQEHGFFPMDTTGLGITFYIEDIHSPEGGYKDFLTPNTPVGMMIGASDISALRALMIQAVPIQPSWLKSQAENTFTNLPVLGSKGLGT